MVALVKHVSIPVENQERALAFYRDILGFKVTTDAAFGEGQRWLELTTPEGETRVILFTFEGHENRVGTFQNIVFASHDVEKDYEELKAKGVEFIMEPTKESWGIYTMFKDTEGNQFVLSSAK